VYETDTDQSVQVIFDEVEYCASVGYGGWCGLFSGETRMLHCIQCCQWIKEENTFKASIYQGSEVIRVVPDVRFSYGRSLNADFAAW